jgi:hypothetical protein
MVNPPVSFSVSSIEDDANDPKLHGFASKTRPEAVDHGSGNGSAAHEVTLAVARESIEASRVWTRNNLNL